MNTLLSSTTKEESHREVEEAEESTNKENCTINVQEKVQQASVRLAKRFQMKSKELQNGRLAMIAAAGFMAQELVNGKGIMSNSLCNSQYNKMTQKKRPIASKGKKH